MSRCCKIFAVFLTFFVLTIMNVDCICGHIGTSYTYRAEIFCHNFFFVIAYH